MKETRITFETAKLAKEKKFNIEVTHCYGENHRECGEYELLEYNSLCTGNSDELINRITGYNDYCWLPTIDYNTQGYYRDYYYSAPTQSLLQKWLRDIHKIEVLVYCNASGWMWELNKSFYKNDISGGTHISWSNYSGINESGEWDTFEEALEDGIVNALKTLK